MDEEEDVKDDAPIETKPGQDAAAPAGDVKTDSEPAERSQTAPKGEASTNPKLEQEDDSKVPAKSEPDERDKSEEEEESKDWLDLPMLAKLDSLHLLTDWQFQNPYKVRQMMKDDDDLANWVSPYIPFPYVKLCS